MTPFVSGTDRELAEAVRGFARGILGRIPAAEESGEFPRDLIGELASLGVLGLTVPEADGGVGASAVAFALVLEELAAVWPSLAVGVAVNSGIVAGTVARLGTPGQRARLLPQLMDGRGLAGFCLTEPSSGSDAASLRSTARRDGEGWVIDGQKLFVTNARYAPFLIVLARVGAAEPRRPHAGITAFAVPTDVAGVTIGPPEKKSGLLASETSTVTFESAHVGVESVIGEIGRAFGQVALAGLDAGRIGIAAQSVGIARGALDRAGAYAQERRQFGQAIASFQAVRLSLAEARTHLEAARMLMLRAAWRKDAGLPYTREAAQAKLYASEMANRVTYAAVQTFGGYGYMREYGVERYARDARATSIYEGTSEVQRLVIARALLSEAA